MKALTFEVRLPGVTSSKSIEILNGTTGNKGSFRVLAKNV